MIEDYDDSCLCGMSPTEVGAIDMPILGFAHYNGKLLLILECCADNEFNKTLFPIDSLIEFEYSYIVGVIRWSTYIK